MTERRLYDAKTTGMVRKVDVLNFGIASTPYKDNVSGSRLKILGLAMSQKTDEDGKIVNASYLVTDEGIIGGVSATAADSVWAAMNLMEEEPGIQLVVTIKLGQSKGQREFIILEFDEA